MGGWGLQYFIQGWGGGGGGGEVMGVLRVGRLKTCGFGFGQKSLEAC